MQICTVFNSLSPWNNASKCSHKLCYGKSSFAVLSLSSASTASSWTTQTRRRSTAGTLSMYNRMTSANRDQNNKSFLPKPILCSTTQWICIQAITPKLYKWGTQCKFMLVSHRCTSSIWVVQIGSYANSSKLYKCAKHSKRTNIFG